MFSLGIEPSITSTNGASSSPRAACAERQQELLAAQRGREHLVVQVDLRAARGSRPSSTSSIAGWPAAVIETESPSQLMPSEIHRMWTSSTPDGFASNVAAMTHPFVCHRSSSSSSASTSSSSPREHLHVEAPRTRAQHSGKSSITLSVPHSRQRPAAGTCSITSSAPSSAVPSRHEPEGEVQRVGDDLAQVPDLHLDPLDPPPGRVARGDRPRCASAIESSCISRSSAAGRRRAGPSRAGRRTRSRPAPCRAARSCTSPISAASSPPGSPAARRAPRRRAPARRTRRACPRWPRTAGRCRGSPHAPATAGWTGTAASRTTIADAGGARELVEHRGDAAARRVAQAAQPRAGGVEQGVDGRPQRAGVGLDVGVELELAAGEHDRRAVLADRARDSRIRSPGRRRSGASRARGSRRPRPVVQMYIPSAWPRSTTFVSPATICTSAAARGARRSPRPRRAGRRRAGPPRAPARASAPAAARRPSRGR